VPCACSPQSENGQNEHDHNDQTNEINYAVHVLYPENETQTLGTTQQHLFGSPVRKEVLALRPGQLELAAVVPVKPVQSGSRS
jgi:hypothetical protein